MDERGRVPGEERSPAGPAYARGVRLRPLPAAAVLATLVACSGGTGQSLPEPPAGGFDSAVTVNRASASSRNASGVK